MHISAEVFHKTVLRSLRAGAIIPQKETICVDEEKVRSIVLADESQSPQGRRDGQLLLREYIMSRDSRAVDVGMRRFDVANSGLMSRDKQLNWLFKAVSNITLLAWHAIEGGMGEARAYLISDMYLQQLSPAFTPEQYRDWYRRALGMYLSLMPPIGASAPPMVPGGYSPAVRKLIGYCTDHAAEPLVLKNISEKLFFKPDYLSARFRSETGITFSTFVMCIKTDAAKELLTGSSMSLSEIAAHLSFSSQSHFTRVFSRISGVSPGQFRRTAAKDTAAPEP